MMMMMRVLVVVVLVAAVNVTAVDNRWGVLVVGPVLGSGDKVLARSVAQMYEHFAVDLAIPTNNIIVIADSTYVSKHGKSSADKLYTVNSPRKQSGRRRNVALKTNVVRDELQIDYSGGHLSAETIVDVMTGRSPNCIGQPMSECSGRKVPDGATVLFYFTAHGMNPNGGVGGCALTTESRFMPQAVRSIVSGRGRRTMVLMFDACFAGNLVKAVTKSTTGVLAIASSATSETSRKGVSMNEVAFRWRWLASNIDGRCGRGRRSRAQTICEAKCTMNQFVKAMRELHNPELDLKVGRDGKKHGTLGGYLVKFTGQLVSGDMRLLNSEVRSVVCSPSQVKRGRVQKSTLPRWLARMFK